MSSSFLKTEIKKRHVEELLTRGVSEVIDFGHLESRLLTGKKLRIKLGIDPTSPYLHLGRAVALLKLKDFQELGHKIVLIIGDFTGVIGDTSDKETERPLLSPKKVRENMRTYWKQAGKILDLQKTEFHYNSEWLAKIGYQEIGRQADQFSLSDFISRENIKKRLTAGTRVSLREVLYPLMQAYDSVAVKADVEIGGTDQRFNLLAGRILQTYYKQPAQDILTVNLVPGTDGRKMSSSWGNTINILDRPEDMFGKIMSLPDELIAVYFEHCTRAPVAEVELSQKQLVAGQKNPRDFKMELALEIVKMCWGEKKANAAKNNFIKIFQKKEFPERLTEKFLANKNIIDVLVLGGLVKSKSEARRLISQGGIKIDGRAAESDQEIIKSGSVLQRGKRVFVRIV